MPRTWTSDVQPAVGKIGKTRFSEASHAGWKLGGRITGWGAGRQHGVNLKSMDAHQQYPPPLGAGLSVLYLNSCELGLDGSGSGVVTHFNSKLV